MMEPILFYLVVNFYALEFIRAKMVIHPKIYSHAWDKLWEDIQDYSTWFNSKLAAMIYDHTVRCVQCELRHCKNRSEFYIPNFFGDGWYKNYDDSICFINSEFNPNSVLRAGKWLFDENNNWWELNAYDECDYGGKSWKDIAEAGLEYRKIPNSVFVDHLIDLEHNNEVMLLKEAGIFQHSVRLGPALYHEMLDDKRYEDEEFMRKYSPYLCQEVLLKLSRYQYLSRDKVVSEKDLVKYRSNLDKLCEKSIELLLRYKPIKWGNKMVSLGNLQESPSHDRDYDEEDGDWY